jgi:hypothetical protein
MPLITRQQKGSKLTIQEMDGNLLWVNNLTEVTYAQLTNLYGNQGLTPGQYYLITDYKTCYDRPDYDQYRNPIAVSNDSYVQGDVTPLMVLATANDRLAINAYQPSYPFDTIKYDINYSTTESGNPAFGRITERVDEWGNRADYDHRTITFKRYRFYTYYRYNPIAGTVQLQSDGTVLGSGTTFTSLTPGDVIAIRNSSETFYQIESIADDTTMTVVGNVITETGGGGFSFFIANAQGYDSYYQNNIGDPSIFELYNTFEAVNSDGCLGTYIGDHSSYFINEGLGDFLLANNVLKDGRYENNIIGDSSYNNTFNDDCTSNRIGYAFRNNITDDDFDRNIIGDFFENNLIISNFTSNKIGNGFGDNTILCFSFDDSSIGNNFYQNWIDYDFDFLSNQIGNDFNNNVIFDDFYENTIQNQVFNNNFSYEFYRNIIGNRFTDNQIYSLFSYNEIGSDFSSNEISNQNNIGFYTIRYNKIGDTFQGNTIIGNFTDNNIGSNMATNTLENEFAYNQIGSYFSGNTTGIYFGYNKIGSYFQDNIIGDGFGYGGGTGRGNNIGSYFQTNTVGEYFYDNIICDQFVSNIIANDFRYNQILYSITSTDFSSATHVYADYNCRIIKGSDLNNYLEYINASSPPATITLVSITS